MKVLPAAPRTAVGAAFEVAELPVELEQPRVNKRLKSAAVAKPTVKKWR
jgi:hypothetical protein